MVKLGSNVFSITPPNPLEFPTQYHPLLSIFLPFTRASFWGFDKSYPLSHFPSSFHSSSPFLFLFLVFLKSVWDTFLFWVFVSPCYFPHTLLHNFCSWNNSFYFLYLLIFFLTTFLSTFFPFLFFFLYKVCFRLLSFLFRFFFCEFQLFSFLPLPSTWCAFPCRCLSKHI